MAWAVIDLLIGVVTEADLQNRYIVLCIVCNYMAQELPCGIYLSSLEREREREREGEIHGSERTIFSGSERTTVVLSLPGMVELVLLLPSGLFST